MTEINDVGGAASVEMVEELLKPMHLPALPERPLASVLIPSYNYARFIGETIESVLNQTYKNFELAICENGSTDNSYEVIENYARRDPRVKLTRKPHGSAASALNAAYRVSCGEIICVLGADDAFMPEKLEKVVQAFRTDPRVGMVSNKILRIDGAGRPLGLMPLLLGLSHGWLGPRVLRGESLTYSISSGLSVRREIAARIFPFPERIDISDDVVLWSLAPLMTHVGALDEPLSMWRRHERNTTPRSSLGYVRNAMSYLEAGYRLQKQYLAGISPRLAEVLPPFDANLPILECKYIEAKIEGDPGAAGLRRRLITHNDFGTLPAARRWFWKISRYLPRPVFTWGLDQWSPSSFSPLRRFLSALLRRDSQPAQPAQTRRPTCVEKSS